MRQQLFHNSLTKTEIERLSTYLTSGDMQSGVERIEVRLIEAVWTLKRLPDNESRWLSTRQSLWPETLQTNSGARPIPVSAFINNKKQRPDPLQIDMMGPVLDLLNLLPDVCDRRIIFWACWHQDGEKLPRIPWVKVKRSLGQDLTRWTLKRRYNNSLEWIYSAVF